MSTPRTLGALALLAVLSGTVPASAQTSRVVLDVPYLTQKDNLCGGAAVAMVFRYWGHRDLAASDFKSLAGATCESIPAGALVKASGVRRSR
jgi:hypothetical protein